MQLKHANTILLLRMIHQYDFPVVNVYVTDYPVVKVHDELSSAQIGQHELSATLSANVDINYCLPIKLYYHVCTVRHIRIEKFEISHP